MEVALHPVLPCRAAPKAMAETLQMLGWAPTFFFYEALVMSCLPRAQVLMAGQPHYLGLASAAAQRRLAQSPVALPKVVRSATHSRPCNVANLAMPLEAQA